MGKLLRKLTCRLVNDNTLRDTVILTSLRTNKRYMFDTYMRELKEQKIYGLCAVIKDKKYAVYSNDELYALMNKLHVENCDINVIPMEDLKALG